MVEELDKSIRRKTIMITFILWLVTAVVGFWQIDLIRDLMLRLLVRFTPFGLSGYDAFRQAQVSSGLGTLLLVTTAVIWIAAIIGSVEYHSTHLGHPSSWRLFAAVIGAEVAIFLLASFI